MSVAKLANVTNAERKKYVLSKKADIEILIACKKLERVKISDGDRKVVKLIKSQLKRDWRTPLLKSLKGMLKKYR